MTRTRLLSAVAAAGLAAVGCGILTGPDDGDRLSIERFTASPTRIDNGAKVMLLWSVEGAESVTIDQGIGEVEASGSMQVSPRATTTYTLSAEGGTSSATATVQVAVGGAGPSPGPSPSASPSPSPSPSASPSPSPSPSAGPNPSPSPSTQPSPGPSPSTAPTAPPTDGARACGQPQAVYAGCKLVVEFPTSGGSGECAQLTRMVAVPTCPVGTGMIRTISFDVFAQSQQGVTWRRAAGGADAVSPAGGALVNGTNTVTTTAVVYDTALTFEVVNKSGAVVMRFTLDHR